MANLHISNSPGSIRVGLIGRISLLTAICLIFLISCSDDGRMKTPSVSVQQLHQMIADGEEILIIDVRTQAEFDDSRPESITRRIPFDSLEYRMGELPADTTAEIYFFCRSGRRSGIATRFVRSKGYAKAYNVDGGIIAWQEAGYPVVSGPLDKD